MHPFVDIKFLYNTADIIVYVGIVCICMAIKRVEDTVRTCTV